MNRRTLTPAGQARRAARECEREALRGAMAGEWERAARGWHRAAGMWLAAYHTTGGRNDDSGRADDCFMAGARALAEADRVTGGAQVDAVSA